MQQHPLIFRGDRQQFAGFLRVPPLHIAQHDDRFLARGQCINHDLHVAPELAARHHPLRIKLIPQPGHVRPMTIGFEGRQRHTAIVRRRAVHQLIEPNQPPFPGHAGPCPVHHNTKDPGCEARPALKPSHPPIHRDPRILHHLLRLGLAANNGGGRPDQRGVETPDELTVSFGVALPQAGQKGRIIEFGRSHRIGVYPLEGRGRIGDYD